MEQHSAPMSFSATDGWTGARRRHWTGSDLHQAAHKVGRGPSFPRDQALPELGEAAVCHDGQRRADLLRDTRY